MTFAQTNPLSVHVLNLENGLPSAQVEVVLEKVLGING
jgi:5-hydroxyisourate hydrolase